MSVVVDISADIERFRSMGLLNILLKDRSTGNNIRWASNVFEDKGESYAPADEILASDVTGDNAGLIRTRASKAKEAQAALTKAHAEVFTPTWVVSKMVSAADKAWWEAHEGATWQDYVRSPRLEITCGEAPYLVNRYDAADGAAVDVAKRIGILDRKLKFVAKHTTAQKTWVKYAHMALQSTYGYEFQGDNLLIARVNVLATLEEFAQVAGYSLPLSTYKKLARTISWNLWQMDGLTDLPPELAPKEKPVEEDTPQDVMLPGFAELFGDDSTEDVGQPTETQLRLDGARIYDWKGKCELWFSTLKGEGAPMKFDYVIGNPPYQETVAKGEAKGNGQKAVKNVFNLFQDAADTIAKQVVVLIYPGGRWIHQSGKGMKEFGRRQMNDVHLSNVTFYRNAKDVFGEVAIADGITIVVKNFDKTVSGFKYTYIDNGSVLTVDLDNPGNEIMPLDPSDTVITQKIDVFVRSHGFGYLHDAILPRSLFRIESNFVANNPGLGRLLDEDEVIDGSTEVKVFTNDKAGKAGRARWFVFPKSVITANAQFVNEWQVVVSSANAGGQKRDNQLAIIDNCSAFGRSRVALRSFKTEREAHNFYKYVKSYLVRFAFLMTDEALSSLGKRVPDLVDYSDNNSLIDFDKDVDSQLFDLLGLDSSERDHVISRVDSIRHKKAKDE